MKFGSVPVESAEGAMLAHAMRVSGRMLKKGRLLSSDDVSWLLSSGCETVVAARFGSSDMLENDAAETVAKALRSTHLHCTESRFGRCNLVATKRGLAVLDQKHIDQLNMVDDAVTVATVAPFQLVEVGQTVASVKIIPFAVARHSLKRICLLAQKTNLIQVAPFQRKTVGLVMSSLEGQRDSIRDKSEAVINKRLERLGMPVLVSYRCHHDIIDVAESLQLALQAGCSPILVFGATATVDRWDVVPSAIVRIGGTVKHFGMPVYPGNLLLLAQHREVSIIGVPGCARSLKSNGFDWVLERIIAGLQVTPADIIRMGCGGLLAEISA